MESRQTVGKDSGEDFLRIPTKQEATLQKNEEEIHFMLHVSQFDTKQESNKEAPINTRCCAMVLDPVTKTLRQCKNVGEKRDLDLDDGNTESNAFCRPHDKIYGQSVRHYKMACDNVFANDPTTGRMMIVVEYKKGDTEKELLGKLNKLRSCYRMRRAHQLAFFYGARCMMDVNHTYPINLLLRKILEIKEKLGEILAEKKRKGEEPRRVQREPTQNNQNRFGVWLEEQSEIIRSNAQSLSPSKKSPEKKEPPKAPAKKKKGKSKGKADRQSKKKEEDSLLEQAIKINRPFFNMVERMKGMKGMKETVSIIYAYLLEQANLFVNVMGKGRAETVDDNSTLYKAFKRTGDYIEMDIVQDKVDFQGKKSERKKQFKDYLMGQYNESRILEAVSFVFEKIQSNLEEKERVDYTSSFTKRIRDNKEINVDYIVSRVFDTWDFAFPNTELLELMPKFADIFSHVLKIFDIMAYSVIPYIFFADMYGFPSIDKTLYDINHKLDFVTVYGEMETLSKRIEPYLDSIGFIYEGQNLGELFMDDGESIDIGSIIRDIDLVKELEALSKATAEMFSLSVTFLGGASKVVKVMASHALLNHYMYKFVTFGDGDYTTLLSKVFGTEFEQSMAEVREIMEELEANAAKRVSSLAIAIKNLELNAVTTYVTGHAAANVRDVLLNAIFKSCGDLKSLTPIYLANLLLPDRNITDEDSIPYRDMHHKNVAFELTVIYYNLAGIFHYEYIINDLLEAKIVGRALTVFELKKQAIIKAFKKGNGFNAANMDKAELVRGSAIFIVDIQSARGSIKLSQVTRRVERMIEEYTDTIMSTLVREIKE
jgi:hypothetical protein